MIVAENLKKSYHQHLALNDVSFEIKAGEIVGLLGLNGAGKSTILKILCSFLLPSGGSAYVDGFSVEENPDAIRRIIGFLPDTPPLYDEMRVAAYLRFVGRLKHMSRATIEDRLKSVMGKTSLSDVADSPLGELSHGYRQRVGIAQALINNPKVLILDEPIGGLDPIQIVEMRDLINSLRGEHTVILSSHILSEVTKTCDRILMIDKGKLVIQGTEEEIERKLSKVGLVHCLVKNWKQPLLSQLKNISGLENVTVHKAVYHGQATNSQGEQGLEELQIQTSQELRPQIARFLIENGVELLELRRAEAGLESIFMRLLKNHKQ